MKQAMNPYLPSYEYIPDAEPHIFNGRVYIYGSHDRFNGSSFCLNDYVTWSAPVDNLGDWRYEGVIYRRNQDPDYRADDLPDSCNYSHAAAPAAAAPAETAAPEQTVIPADTSNLDTD